MAKAAPKKNDTSTEVDIDSLVGNDNSLGNDGAGLNTLRDILFGPQVQATDSRLVSLEKSLLQTKKELSKTIDEEIGKLRETGGSQLKTSKQEFEWQLEKQNTDQTTQLRNVQEEQKLALDKLSTNFDERLQTTQKKLSDKIDELSNKLSEQMIEMQADFRNRDDNLRQQILTLSAWLDERKASREDLSEMLIDMGKNLQKAKKSNLIDTGNEESE